MDLASRLMPLEVLDLVVTGHDNGQSRREVFRSPSCTITFGDEVPEQALASGVP